MIEFETREQYERYKAAAVQRGMQAALQPYFRAKVDAMAVMMKSLYVFGTGVVQVKYSEDDQRTIDKFDVLIVEARDFYLSKIDPNPA